MGTPFDPSVHSIIKGADGSPVPQYYDPEANDGDGGFVVQQTGSIVEIAEAKDITIAPDEEYRIVDAVKCPYKEVRISTREAQNCELKVQSYMPTAATIKEEIKNITDFYGYLKYEHTTNKLNVIITNNSDSDVTFKLTIFGVI